MRKVALASLFLILFNLNGQNSTLDPDYNNLIRSKEDIKNAELVKQISYALKGNEKLSLSWSDNLPMFSPLSVDSITRISDFYGFRKVHPVLKVPRYHFGIDFSAKVGTPVHSTANGIIEKIQHNKHGYGNCIIIDHGDGYKTRYAHLREIFVKEGDYVKLNDIIGNVGNTGMSTGNHLHYEVIFNNKPIDPMSFYFTNPTKANGDEYMNILIEMENTKKQLLNNNTSFWEQVGVFNKNQNFT